MNAITKAEREVIRWSMARLKTWKKQNPNGPIPFGKPGGIETKAGYNMVLACLELERLRKLGKSHD